MADGESTYEQISLYLPLPYRILLITIFSIWLFALNLHYLHVVRIDVGQLLRYTRGQNDPFLHSSVYQIATLLSVIFAANLTLFWIITGGEPELIRRWEVLPMSLFLVFLAVFLWPVGGWHHFGRRRFVRMFRRIIIGGIDKELRFADILLADALTSCAKVLGDLAVVIGLFFSSTHSATDPLPDRSMGGRYMVPAFIALPYLCRLRQCLTEYLRAKRKALPKSDRRPHLYNAAKYASAFPVIILSALQREHDPNAPHFLSKSQLEKSWYFAVAFNSLFSFWWDVTKDWELTIFCGSDQEHPWGLREKRHFVTDEMYYGAILTDFMLRATWSVKLSPHLEFVNEMEGGMFTLQLMEIFRRWMWVFFRIEKEWIATGQGMGKDLEMVGGIPLGEYED